MVSMGFESNTDCDEDSVALIHVLMYENNQLLGEFVINEDYYHSYDYPLFVISPATDPYNIPSVPGYSTSIEIGEIGDSTIFNFYLGAEKFSTLEKWPMIIYEQQPMQRFERFFRSEINCVGFWNIKQFYQPINPPFPKGGAEWKMDKNNSGQMHYKYNWLGDYGVQRNEHFVWNSYERDGHRASMELGFLYDLNDNNPSTNLYVFYGNRKYLGDVYAFDPATNGPTNTYNLSNHGYVWATVWVYGPNGNFRVWRVIDN